MNTPRSSSSSFSRLVVLAILLVVVNTNAIQFLAQHYDCTNENDGVLMNQFFLAAPACQSVSGGTSLGGSCSSGEYKHFNSTDCTGVVLSTFGEECAASSGSSYKIRSQCADINDAEYIRNRIYPHVPGSSSFDCNATAQVMTVFARLNFCFEGNSVNQKSYKTEKVNSTAYSMTEYTATGCNSANIARVVTTRLTDYVCTTSGMTLEFVLAGDVGNSANLAQVSSSIMGLALVLVSMLVMW